MKHCFKVLQISPDTVSFETLNLKRWMYKLVILSLMAFVYYSGCGNSPQADMPVKKTKESGNQKSVRPAANMVLKGLKGRG